MKTNILGNRNLYGRQTPIKFAWATVVLAILFPFGSIPVAFAQHNSTTIADFPKGLVHEINLDPDGNIFGVETYYLSHDVIIFKIAKGTHDTTTIASFSGYIPSNITFDSAGNIFGITTSEAETSGTIFEIVKGSHTITTLDAFHDTYLTSLILDKEGNLVGTTLGQSAKDGQAEKASSVFEIMKGSHTIITLASFHGEFPVDLKYDSMVDIFGTTLSADANNSTVFEITPTSHVVTTVASFHGASPAFIAFDNAKNLFGTITRTHLINSLLSFQT